MKEGDWVYSFSKGIWQITSVDDIESVFPSNSVYTTVHSKRFLNSSYKKSLSVESCSPVFIRPLPKTEIQKVNEIIKSNPKWYKEFLDFSKRVDSILNLTFYVADKNVRVKLKKSISIKFSKLDQGLTDLEIMKLLEREFQTNKQSSIRNLTAQFVSKQSEVKNKRLLYRELKFLDF